MSWHFSQALVAEYLAENCLGGGRYVPWKSMPSALDDSCSAKMKDTLHRSPYGMMYVPLTEAHGKALLTWFLEVFLARTSVVRPGRRASALKDHGVDYGVRCTESQVKFDRLTCLWKTHQCLFTEVLPESLVILPAWGMTVNGVVFRVITPVLKRTVSGYGWLRRPLATDRKFYVLTKQQMVTRRTQKKSPMNWMQQAIELSGLNKAWANVRFAEHLMMWPVNWTALEPLETAKFQQWLNLHGKS